MPPLPVPTSLGALGVFVLALTETDVIIEYLHSFG